MEASEEKRTEYKKVIADIPLEKLVYIDESGIEMKIIKDRGWGIKKEKLSSKKSGKHYERKYSCWLCKQKEHSSNGI